MKVKNKSQELREFGYLMGGMIILIFALIIPFFFDRIFGESIVVFAYTTPIWPWLIACCFWLPALIWSKLLKPFYFIWMKVGLVLGWINTRIIMLLMFFGMMFPIGLLLRLFGKNPMSKNMNEETYRVKSTRTDKNHLERPY